LLHNIYNLLFLFCGYFVLSTALLHIYILVSKLSCCKYATLGLHWVYGYFCNFGRRVVCLLCAVIMCKLCTLHAETLLSETSQTVTEVHSCLINHNMVYWRHSELKLEWLEVRHSELEPLQK